MLPLAIQKLVESYATLVMGNRMKIEEVPETRVVGGVVYQIRQEVEFEIARRTIEAIG